MDKLQRCSASYYTTRLFLAGRTTLAKSVLSIYTMQTTVFPHNTYARLDALCCGFIWESRGEHRKIHLVNGDLVYRPKGCAGLGMRKSVWVNEAFMMKMAKGLFTSREDFWVKIIRGKYLPNGGVPNSQGGGQTSRLWQGICNI